MQITCKKYFTAIISDTALCPLSAKVNTLKFVVSKPKCEKRITFSLFAVLYLTVSTSKGLLYVLISGIAHDQT